MESNDLESLPSFDEEYSEKEELFGHPYHELQDYFKNYSKKGSVLDLGCGQGRDAIFFASLGYQVTAVDNSQIGISQMMNKSKEKKLKITGIVDDVFNIQFEETFDIILFDMLLHSVEKQQQLNLLKKYSSYLNSHGILCIVFPDDMTTNHFMSLLTSLPYNWELLDEIRVRDVPKLSDKNVDNSFTFIMIVIQLSS